MKLHGFQQFMRFNVDIFNVERKKVVVHADNVQRMTISFDLDQMNQTRKSCFGASLHINQAEHTAAPQV